MSAFHVSAAGGRLSFADLPGREPAVVFIHGLGASAEQAYGDVARRPPFLAHRRILVDLFGFGESDHPSSFSYSIEDHAASVAALLDHLRLRDVVLVGHSMGGAVAIVVARTRPDLLSRLILAEAHLDAVAGSISGAVLSGSEQEFAGSGQAALAHRCEEEGATSYAAAIRKADPVGMYRSARSLVAPRTPTFREMLLGLSLLVSFLFGGNNESDPDVAWLPAHGIPVRVVPDAGHDIMNHQPAAFAAALAAILE